MKCAVMVLCPLDGTARLFTVHIFPGLAVPCYCDRCPSSACLPCWFRVRCMINARL